jgi:hypothetical protein
MLYFWWLEAEFDSKLGLAERTAQNFMNVASMFGKSETVSDLPVSISVLYLLAAPSTPDEARQEVLALVESGERITKKKAQEVIRSHKAPEPVAAFVTPDLTLLDFWLSLFRVLLNCVEHNKKSSLFLVGSYPVSPLWATG